MANGAYWFDDSTGNFISSSCYCEKLPDWLTAFNDRRYPDSLIRKNWETLYPLSTYKQSLPDDNPYEGKFKEEKAPVFPHDVAIGGYYRLRFTPAGNTLTFKVAKACIKAEELGQGDETDFLCLSFSSTDYAGHRYGPNAIEVEDMFLRFDQELAEFLKYLDNKIGVGEYTVFLSADHGGAHNATYMKDLAIPAGNISEDTILKRLNDCVDKYPDRVAVKDFVNYQFYLPVDTTGGDRRGRQKRRIFD
jgi:predicted AlkP superfamily pyrophosphatase or phosphodiesterase